MRQNGLAITQADSQLRGLSTLQQRIGMANASGLSAIRGEVVATIAATQALVQQAQQGASASQSSQVALTQASEAARNNVKDFMQAYYDEHKFDSYLHFASAEEEGEYRKRELARKQAIDKALAEHTPNGNLKANQLSIEQLKDAGVHGADKSPDFKPMLERLETDGAKLKTAIVRSSPKATEHETAAKAPDGDLSSAVTPDVLASIKSTKIAMADQTQDGHGLNTSSLPKPGQSRA